MKPYFIKYLAFFLVLTLAGCKYEDGPVISLRSAKKRLIAPWRPLNAYKDGKDVTISLWVGQSLSFTDDKEVYMTGISEPLLYSALSGTWEFKDHKKTILITLTDSSYWKGGDRETVSIDPKVVEWKILRLKNNPVARPRMKYGYGKGELWVEEERAEGNYEFHFEVLTTF